MDEAERRPAVNGGPFVIVACVVERVLTEADEVRSLIRLVDGATVGFPAGLPAPEATIVEFPLVLQLASGDVTGEHQISIVVHRPDGSTAEPVGTVVQFDGAELGVFVEVELRLQVTEGLYWFQVMLDGERELTRVPLRIRYHRPQG